MADKEQYLYHCDGNKKCKHKKNGCYKYGGPCKLTTDKKHAIDGPNTVTIDLTDRNAAQNEF